MDLTFLTALEHIVGPDGIVRDPVELATYESDGLARLRSKPGVAVLPGNAGEVQQVVQLCHVEGRAVRCARTRDRALGWGFATTGGCADRDDAAQPHSRHRHTESTDHGRAWCHEHRRDERGVVRGLLLRARSVESGHLLDRGGTSPRTRVARTASSTASRFTMCLVSKRCCPTGR